MLRRRINHLNFAVRLAMLLLPLVSFAGAAYLRFASGLIAHSAEIDPRDYVALLLFTTLIWVVVVEHYNLVDLSLVFTAGFSARTAVRACAVTYLVVTGATFFFRAASYSRLFVALSAFLQFLLLLLTRYAFWTLLSRARRKGHSSVRILFVGTDEIAGRAAGALIERMGPSIGVAGYVRLPGQEVTVSDAPVLDLNAAAIRQACGQIDDVIIAIPFSRFAEISAVKRELGPLCVPMRAILEFGNDVVVQDALFDFDGIPMLDLHVTPAEGVRYLIAKRGFDLCFSLFALLATAPLMAIIALAIRLTSTGPLVFTQERVGLNGRIFRMYKFRTMRVSDTAESDTRWTTREDSRLTRLGAAMRSLNLDELPQLFNVMMGEMSIVGPRPERPFFVEKFMQEVAQYNTRHYLKVGITGWAQVNGWRGDTSIARRVEYDLYYLRNWSMLFDLKIILLTLWRTFAPGKSAS